jgi:hypothetical protein
MNHDDIISMAREAGFTASNGFSQLIVRHSNGSWVDVAPEAETMTNLAYEAGAAAERERIEAVGRLLYEITGDILDINTLLIQRNTIRART